MKSGLTLELKNKYNSVMAFGEAVRGLHAYDTTRARPGRAFNFTDRNKPEPKEFVCGAFVRSGVV